MRTSLLARLSFIVLGAPLVTSAAVLACSSDDDNDNTGTSTTADASTNATDTGTTTTTADGSTTDGSTVVTAGDGGIAPTSTIVDAASAFLDSLTTAQKTTANIAFTQQAAETWTNLPGGNRNGVQYQDMSAAAQTTALALAEAVLSSAGYKEMNDLRAADSVIAQTPGASGWGAGLTHFAILGTPSLTDVWMVQICAHHLVYNIVYNGNTVGATPVFLGTEPPNWTLLADGGTLVTGTDSTGATVSWVNGTLQSGTIDATGGTAEATIEPQRVTVDALLTAILADPTASSAAKLSGSFSDVVYGINATSGGDFNYPFSSTAGDTVVYPTGTTGRGALYSTLPAAAQTDVKTAIEAWVKTQADDISSNLLAAYESDDALAATYVGYGVPSANTAPSFAANPNATQNASQWQGSYIRIDGPRVLIEFVVQDAVAYRSQGWVHYHTVWRDKTADYGGEFKGGITVDAGTGTGPGGGGPGGDGGGPGGGGPGGDGGAPPGDGGAPPGQ